MALVDVYTFTHLQKELQDWPRSYAYTAMPAQLIVKLTNHLSIISI